MCRHGGGSEISETGRGNVHAAMIAFDCLIGLPAAVNAATPDG